MIVNSRFRKTLLGLPALAFLSATAVTTAQAQTAPQVQLQLRAVSNDDIAAYKLPSTTQRSAGITTVGLGQPGYLEALVDASVAASDIGGVTWTLTKKPANSNAVLEDGPMNASVPPYEPSDRVAFRVAGRKMLRPDVVGRYTVTASVSVGSRGTVDVTTTLTAGTYVGIKACSTCHSGGPESTTWSMVHSWSKTSHSTIFKDGVNGVASDHYAASCLGCHTVGYDAASGAVNGGFDDVAAQVKWVFPTVQKAGTFEALPDALKNVGNIQCENCHGPGSQHVASGGDPRLISVSTDTGDCGQCHGALTHHAKSGEWANSRHAIATRDPSGAGREGCVGCHTNNGFVGKLQGAKTVNTTYGAIGCQTCHEPHGRTAPEDGANLIRTVNSVQLPDGTQITQGGKGLLCMNCHMSRQNAAQYAATAAASARFGPHHGPQADMLAGANAFTYGQEIPSSAHTYAVDNTCVTCHMQAVEDATSPAFTKAGGHTFNAKAENGTELVGACQDCHGPKLTTFNFKLFDYDGDGKIDGVQTEVQHLLDQLSALLPPVGQAKTALTIDATWTRAQLEGAYNWQFVHEDGSLGIHNTAYTVGLLKASIADLKSKK